MTDKQAKIIAGAIIVIFIAIGTIVTVAWNDHLRSNCRDRGGKVMETYSNNGNRHITCIDGDKKEGQ